MKAANLHQSRPDRGSGKLIDATIDEIATLLLQVGESKTGSAPSRLRSLQSAGREPRRGFGEILMKLSRV